MKKENAIESMMKSEELKEEAKSLEDKLRPIVITNFSAIEGEREVLFAPLSSFKINSYPEKV